MKTLFKTLLIISSLTLSSLSYAQQPANPPSDSMAMDHDMSAMDPAKALEHLKKKQEHQLMMHDLSNKILAEKDPQKQQALKDQQLELMKAHQQHMMKMHHGKPMDHQKMQH